MKGKAVKGVILTDDHRGPDGQGVQCGEWQGFAVSREWAKPLLGYDPETGTFTYAPEPAKAGPWRFYVSTFGNRREWPEHPDYDGNCGHVLRADGSTEPVRMYGRKLFVTPNGTSNWNH